MKRTHHLDSCNPWLAGVNLALASTQLLVSSAEVVGWRMNRMLLAGPQPNARDRSEMIRMGSEKVTAGMASFQAMARGWLELNGQLATMAMQQALALAPMMMQPMGTAPAQAYARQVRIVAALLSGSARAQTHAATALPSIASKGLKPIQARARSNVRRLRAR